MKASALLVLYGIGPAFAASTSMDIAKRSVLTDLSGGWCRSYKFGAAIANDILYMVGLDGGLIPEDGNSDNHYLVTLDLMSSISVNDGANYKLTIINDTVPDVKYQTLWPNEDNSTLYMYGGLFVGNVSDDNGPWIYDTSEKTWQAQPESIIPLRLVNGANTNVPEIQAAYWIGGYQASDTTVTITDSTTDYASGMIQLNTTTGVYTTLDAPFTPVQDGSLSYIPVGDMGILVYIGGETPSIQDGINATMTPNAWNYVQVYDIASAKWYNQTTTGSVSSRTQYCASVQHDESTGTYEIFVISGADYESHDVIKDVSYLSIPSFKWYQANPLGEGRMTMDCASYGSQIFGVGGRLAWYVDERAGCYEMPAFIYDADSQSVRSEFDPTLTTYTVSSSTKDDIETSPYPSKWADSSLKSIFVSSTTGSNNFGTSTSTPTAATKATSGSTNSINKGAIAGGVIGGVAGAALIVGLVYYAIVKNRQKKIGLTGSPSGGKASELWGADHTPELEGNSRSEMSQPSKPPTFELAEH